MMYQLNQSTLKLISGGEFVPGTPTVAGQCLTTKLLVTLMRDEPGYDIPFATALLQHYCIEEFESYLLAHEFAATGGSW